MFDIGWPELMVVIVIAVLVVGPKEMPNAIRTVMALARKLRVAANQIQSGLDDIARESGVDDVKRKIDEIEFYDPGDALDSIAGTEKDELGLDEFPDPLSGKSIFDPEGEVASPHVGATETGAIPEGSSNKSVVKPAERDGTNKGNPSADEPTS
ncbi:MAG: twin-arginine translocase subunit TatB [Alphaproteobacteria bacterium]|nr:twin-arginine translocase subunit TatB [Alphaproteobacteria bacterium]